MICKEKKKKISFMNEEIFKNTGLKKTKNRIVIYEALEKIDYPITADEIYEKLKDDDVDLSTIYRTMNSFIQVGIVKKEVNEQKENVFLLLRNEENHILVCTSCHKKVKLPGCPYHEVNEEIEKKTGFIVQDQNVEIYGLCPECQCKNKK